MSSGINVFETRQAFIFCTTVLTAAYGFGISQLFVLKSRVKYWFFFAIFLVWIALNLSFLILNPASRGYFWIYTASTPTLWFLYLLAAYKVYEKIFSEYPGITFLVKWILLAAGVSIVATVLLGVAINLHHNSPGRLFSQVTSIDRNLIAGVAVFLVVMVSVISRYPIYINRNLIVHLLAFSFVLITQSFALFANAASAYKYSGLINNSSALLTAVAVTLWGHRLSEQGDLIKVRTRTRLDPALEFRLLGELASINNSLLRAGQR